MRLGAVVHVDVIDDGCIGLPQWREACGHDEDGRGFKLVNALAERWGFLPERSGMDGACRWQEPEGYRKRRGCGNHVVGCAWLWQSCRWASR